MISCFASFYGFANSAAFIEKAGEPGTGTGINGKNKTALLLG